MKLYGGPTFNALKPAIVIAETGLDCEYVNLDLGKGEAKTPDHLQRHPLGKIPALEIASGQYLMESGAIAKFLCKQSDSELYPSDAYVQAQIDQWVDYMGYHPGRWLSVFFWNEVVLPKYYEKSPDQEALKEAGHFLSKQLGVLEKQIENHSFLVGQSYSLADIIAYSYVRLVEITSVDLGDFPALRRWYETIGPRPAVKQAHDLVGF